MVAAFLVQGSNKIWMKLCIMWSNDVTSWEVLTQVMFLTARRNIYTGFYWTNAAQLNFVWIAPRNGPQETRFFYHNALCMTYPHIDTRWKIKKEDEQKIWDCDRMLNLSSMHLACHYTLYQKSNKVPSSRGNKKFHQNTLSPDFK